MEIHPVDGNPTKGWLDFHPSVPKWLDGNPTILRSKADKVLWSVFKFSTFPFWSFQNYESESGLQFTWIWRFSSVEMGSSLAVSCLNVPFLSWCWAKEKWTWCLLGGLKGPSIDDSCSAMSYTSGFFALQLQRLHQPGCGSGEEASFVFCLLATKVAIKYLCICLFVPEWVRSRA